MYCYILQVIFSHSWMLIKNQTKDPVPRRNRPHLFGNYQIQSTAVQRAADNVTALPLRDCAVTAADTIHCRTRIWHLRIRHLAKSHYF